jgi:hypothetical protein
MATVTPTDEMFFGWGQSLVEFPITIKTGITMFSQQVT